MRNARRTDSVVQYRIKAGVDVEMKAVKELPCSAGSALYFSFSMPGSALHCPFDTFGLCWVELSIVPIRSSTCCFRKAIK